MLGPIVECGAVCWDRYREGQVNALNRVQMRAAKFADNINESGWESLALRCTVCIAVCTAVCSLVCIAVCSTVCTAVSSPVLILK